MSATTLPRHPRTFTSLEQASAFYTESLHWFWQRRRQPGMHAGVRECIRTLRAIRSQMTP